MIVAEVYSGDDVRWHAAPEPAVPAALPADATARGRRLASLRAIIDETMAPGTLPMPALSA